MREKEKMNTLLSIVQTINAYLSDYILIVLLIGTGVYFSVRTKFVQVRCFGEGMKKVFGNLSLHGGRQHGGIVTKTEKAGEDAWKKKRK